MIKEEIKTTNNSLKLLVILATIFLVWNNIESFTLNSGGEIHTFQWYFTNPMMYIILMAFGYLSLYNNIPWKDYWKFLITILILNCATGLIYFNWKGFIGKNFIVSILIIEIIKKFLFDYGKWMVWIIFIMSALLKWSLNNKWLNKQIFIYRTNTYKIINLLIIFITIILLIIVAIPSIYFFIISKSNYIYNFNNNLIFIAFSEGNWLQIIPGLLTFLIGVNLRLYWSKLNFLKKYCNKIFTSLTALSIFIMVSSLRMIFNFPLIFWDVTVILQALTILIVFLTLEITNYRYLDFYFYGTIFTLYLHIAFSWIISFDFIAGALISWIFGLSFAYKIQTFFNLNLIISLIYSLIRLVILMIWCSWFSKLYYALFNLKILILIKKNKIKH